MAKGRISLHLHYPQTVRAPAAQRRYMEARHVSAGKASDAIRVPPGTAQSYDRDTLASISAKRLDRNDRAASLLVRASARR